MKKEVHISNNSIDFVPFQKSGLMLFLKRTKGILLLAIALHLFTASTAFAQCDAFSALMQEGNKYAGIGKYEKAVNAFTSAMIACPDSSQIAADKIASVFKTIEALKRQAESDKRRAELNERKATIQAYTSKSLVITSQAKDWAKKGLYTEALALLCTAYDTVQLNGVYPPTPLQVAIVDMYYGKESTWQKARFNLYTGKVTSVAFAPDGNSIITGSQDKTTILWNLKGKPIQTFKGHTDEIHSVTFAPDGKSIITGGKDKTAILWDLKGNPIQTFKHSVYVTSVAFAPDGKSIITGSADKTAILWDLNGHSTQAFKGHTDYYVNSVAFAPDSKNIITGSGDSTAILWDLKGNPIQTFKGHTSKVYSVVFAPDGKSIITGSGDSTVILWDLKGNPIQTFKGHADGIYSVAFAPDGKSIITGGSAGYSQPGTTGIAILWDLNGKQLQTFKGHTNGINSVAFAPDGKSIITGSYDKTAILWDLKGNPIQTFRHSFYVTSVAFAPDGKSIIMGSADKTAILWDLKGKPVQTFKGHTDGIYSVAFAPDGKTIITGSYDNTAILWDLNGKPMRTFKGHTSYVLSVAFAPDGKSIATGGSDYIAIQSLTAAGIKETLHSEEYLKPKQQESIGLTIIKSPKAQLKTWVLWSHGQYWESKKEYQRAKSFYKQYAQRHDAPQAHIALSRIDKALGQAYTYNFAGSQDVNALIYYGEELKDSLQKASCYKKALSMEERALARIGFYQLNRENTEGFLQTNIPEYLEQYADFLVERRNSTIAIQAYQKSLTIEERPSAKIWLYKITKKEQADFLKTENPFYLILYSQYFQSISYFDFSNDTMRYQNYAFADQLYQKAFNIKSSSITSVDSTDWANTQGQLARYALLIGRPQDALQACQKGLGLDATAVEINRSLALAYLLNGLYEKAIKEYEKTRSKQYDSYYDVYFLEDLNMLEKAGLIPDVHKEEVEKVREFLGE